MSLAGQHSSSLFKTEHVLVLHSALHLVKCSFLKCEKVVQGNVHFPGLATGVARLSSDGKTDMRGQAALPDISR